MDIKNRLIVKRKLRDGAEERDNCVELKETLSPPKDQDSDNISNLKDCSTQTELSSSLVSLDLITIIIAICFYRLLRCKLNSTTVMKVLVSSNVTLHSVFDYVVPPKSNAAKNSTKLDSFQEFIIALAKLRLDSPLQEFAYRFRISTATSRIFLKCWISS